MPTEQLLTLAALLKPVKVRDYAKARNWKAIEGVNRPLYLLSHATESLCQIRIPKDCQSDDFAEAMLAVVRRMADAEARPVTAVLSELLSPEADVLWFRVSGASTNTGTLSLERGIHLLKGVKQTLLSAAHDVLSPDCKHHPRLGKKEATGLLDACRLGQTERGSYVVSVACPLDYDADDDPQMELFASKVPLGRSTARNEIGRFPD